MVPDQDWDSASVAGTGRDAGLKIEKNETRVADQSYTVVISRAKIDNVPKLRRGSLK